MFEAIKRMFARSNPEDKMYVDEEMDGTYFIYYEDGNRYAGPYKREKDAKGQLTRMRKSYTPASRRPNKEA